MSKDSSFINGHIVGWKYGFIFDVYCLVCGDGIPFLRGYSLQHKFLFKDPMFKTDLPHWWHLHWKCFHKEIVPNSVVREQHLYTAGWFDLSQKCTFCLKRIKGKTKYYILKCQNLDPKDDGKFTCFKQSCLIDIHAHQGCWLWRKFRPDIDDKRKILVYAKEEKA